MKPQEMFGDLWKVAGPRQRKIMRRISFIGEKKVKPALARLQIVSEHCVATGQQDLLFEAGLIDYSELEVINEGWMDDLKKAGSGLADRATKVAKAGTELVRRPPQKGEFKDEVDVLELFKLVGMQYGGVDVQGVKKELGDNWDDLKGAAGGAKEALVQAMKTVKGTMKDLLGQVTKLNEWINKQGRKFQEIGIVQWADKTVDDKLANFNKALQDYQNKKEEPGTESESKEDSTPKLIQYASKIGEYAKEHPIKAALPIIILTMATTLLVGPIAAIAVGLFLRTGMGMLKSPNEKFSSALGAAAKTAAIGLAAGGVVDAVGDAIGGGAEAGAEGAVEAGGGAVDGTDELLQQFGDRYAGAIEQLTRQNWSPEQIEEILKNVEFPNDAEDLLDGIKDYQLENPGVTPAGGMGFPGAEGAPGAEIQTGPELGEAGGEVAGEAGGLDGAIGNLQKAAEGAVGRPHLNFDLTNGVIKIGEETFNFSDMSKEQLEALEAALKANNIDNVRIWDSMGRHGNFGESHNLTGPVLFEAKKTTDTSEYML